MRKQRPQRLGRSRRACRQPTALLIVASFKSESGNGAGLALRGAPPPARRGPAQTRLWPQPGACLQDPRGRGFRSRGRVYLSVGARRPRPRPPLVGPVSRGTRPHCVRARDAQARGRREGRGEAKRVLGSSASTPCPRSGGSVCSPLLAS